jgi:hypothetical protein
MVPSAIGIGRPFLFLHDHLIWTERLETMIVVTELELDRCYVVDLCSFPDIFTETTLLKCYLRFSLRGFPKFSSPSLNSI